MSLCCFGGALWFWRAGNRWAAESRPATAEQAAATNAAQTATLPPGRFFEPFALASRAENIAPAGALNAAPGATPLGTNTGRVFAHRLSNTPQPLSRLIRSDSAVLLENALIDTALGTTLEIPAELRAQGDPGAYIVQADRAPDQRFRQALESAGAQIISYIPNNAFLVRGAASVAQRLASAPGVRSVLPYEPYYKIKPALLRSILEPDSPQAALPPDARLNVLLFADARENTLAQLEALGARLLQEQRSPFGPLVRVLPGENTTAAMAALPGVQMLDVAREKILASDLARAKLQVAADSTAETNYMGLTGSNVVVGLADRGVSPHPDYTNRVFWDDLFLPGITNDLLGHGTHVAGIIIGDGTMSSTVSNAQGSMFSPPSTNHFRGMAPEAKLFTTLVDISDTYLQERAARSNIFIWNNSWNYAVNDYDIAAASYDAAVRDALPEVTGSTPILYVMPGGNAGAINSYAGGAFDAGQGGVADTILSPATAKNVITVGAVEQRRDITNEVIVCDPVGTTNNCSTNTPWRPLSDADDEVAGYSSRGNVGIGIEGENGRFKPDVVAPGSFILSTRSPVWDTNSYYNPVTVRRREFNDIIAGANGLAYQSLFIPDNAVNLRVAVMPNRNSPQPFPILPIYVSRNGWPTNTPGGYEFVERDNELLTPPDGGALAPIGQGWYFAIGNDTGQPVSFDLITEVGIVTDGGSRTNAMIALNDEVAPYYRYESGSSMAAGAAAGVIALMQDFFTNRLATNVSPALMKALVINGARSVGNRYNFQVASAINYQGWGMMNLPGSLHPAMTNVAADGTSMAFYDQSPETALATGDSQSFQIELTPDAIEYPLRVTLVWSDPPGNPLASIKLVNDLDLVVTNNQTGEVFFGNDIQNGNDYNNPWDTNAVPLTDVVNNVENIYLNSSFFSSLGTNYTVTVIGRRINVNAVTAHTNNIAQDYALVISSGNGESTNGLKITRMTLPRTVSPPLVTMFTNMFGNTESDYGGILQKQHVGANSPLLGTNTLPYAGGVMTIGQTSQWHFYVLTNDATSRTYTNAAFLTFLPPNLSLPRMGARELDPDNASRPEADIDLYVSTDASLTNLNPLAISNSWKSSSGGGTETVVITNGGGVDAYYLGVKSEDQRAAEYSILGVVSQNPFGEEDAEGNQTLRGFPVPGYILDGTSERPGVTYGFAIGVYPIPVRRVVVTNILSHELMGDLVTALRHGQNMATLNNHTTNLAVFNAWFTYDDSDERNTFTPSGGAPQRSDGPGTLMDFGGQEGVGQWLLTYVDNAPGHVGTNQAFTVFLERQQDLENGITALLEPGACRVDYIDVPPDATNLTVSVVINSGTGPVSLEVCPLNTAFGGCVSDTFTNAVGGSVSIDRFRQPLLVPTTYSVRTCNLGLDRVEVFIKATIGIDPNPPAVTAPSTGGPMLIKDDAVTYSSIFITNHSRVAEMDVGLLIRHPRISDLAITLIGPNGDRVLLFEDRGNTSAAGLGSFLTVGGVPAVGETNHIPLYSNDFESVPTGPYGPSALVQGWTVLSNVVGIVPDLSVPWRSNNILVLADGAISNTVPTLFPSAYRLSYETIHAPYIVGTVSWWPLDGNALDVFSGLDGLPLGNANFQPGKSGLAFYGDGSATRIMVPRAPELNVGIAQGITIEGWIYPLDVIGARMPIAQWSEGTNGAQPGVQFWATDLSQTNHTPGALSVALWGTAGETNYLAAPTGTLTNRGWQHVAFTYLPPPEPEAEIGGEARLYVNGRLAAIDSFPTNFIPDTRADLWLGFDPTTFPGGRAFLGGIDEVGLYQRALAANEIEAIVRAGSGGKHGTNALTTPVATELTLRNTAGTQVLAFTNGLNWGAGPRWETNVVDFTLDATGQPSTVLLRPLEPNAAIDNIRLSVLVTNAQDGLVHFTDNTNIAPLMVKFAPTPFQMAYAAPALRFTNYFERALPGVYSGTNVIPGSFNPDGVKDWTVITNTIPGTNTIGAVTVVSNFLFSAPWTNSVVLGNGGIESSLPTQPGGRYRLQYAVRGPGAVGWWNGDMNPLNRRAFDLVGGNDGAMLYGATNMAITNAFVTNRFAGRTTNVFYFNGAETNAYASKIELGDPENLRLTNSFTIEAWILPMPHTNAYGTEQIFFRGDSRQCLDPYFLALERVDDLSSDLRFHVEDGSRACGVDLRTTGGLIERGLTNWQHVAAVFEARPFGSNLMSLYYNGALVASNITTMIPMRDLDPAHSPGVAIGNRSRADNSQPFRGYIDELTVYARALTAPEIASIGTNAAGKADMSLPPEEGLARLELSLDGQLGERVSGRNAGWTVHTFEFTARQTNVLLTLRGLTPGTAVAGISLVEVRPELSYQPEQSLSLFNGLDPYGLWRLEIWDTRANSGAGGVIPLLVQWQLDFKIAPDNRPAAVPMFHGIPALGRVEPRGTADFAVQVPQWARRATNVLLYARDDLGAATPVGVLYNTNYIAFGPTNTLFWPPVASGTNILRPQAPSQPLLWIGQPYYLTVTNPNNTPVNFSLGVWFDIMTLTNCEPATNYAGPAGIPRYFQFEVPTNGSPAELLPQVVSFWLTGANTNLTVVLSQSLPLPDLGHYDYISAAPSTNDEIVMLVTNSTPFPLFTNRWWYAGVFNSRETNVPFTVLSCVSLSTNQPDYLPLELGDSMTLFEPLTGPPQRTFFEVLVTNPVTAILFELYDMDGNGDLVLQRDVPPTMAPYLRGSFAAGTADEQIVLRPSFDMPDLRGRYYLGVINNENGPLNYSLRAATTNAEGLLISEKPIVAQITPTPYKGPLITWNAIEGETYYVQFTTRVRRPVYWTNLATITATTRLASYQVPVRRPGLGFYRIAQTILPFVPEPPPLDIELAAPDLLRIAWPAAAGDFRLQYTEDFVTWIDWPAGIKPILRIGGEFVTFDAIGPVPRFYRLRSGI